MGEPISHNLDIKDTQPLKGKVAVVTGTSRGIGAEIARSLAQVGVDIIGNHVDPTKVRRQDRVATDVTGHGVSFQSVVADISEPEGRQNLLTAAIGKDPTNPHRIDYLVLNAAGGLEEGKPEGWAERINIESQLALVDQFVPYMNRGGKIIYLTSLWAHRYGEVKQLPAYEPVARTKNAAEKALRAKIEELEERGISLGVLSGHVIKGTAAHTLFTRGFKERMEQLEQQAEGGKFPDAADMGNAVRDMLLVNFDSGFTKHVGGTQAEPLEKRTVQTFDREAVSKRLPMYGDAKLLVDQFTSSEDGKSGVGRYTVRGRDTEGHFGGQYEDIQLFRGVDQIEAAAQTVGLTYLTGHSETEAVGVFTGVKNARFEHMVFPGDEVEMHAQIVGETPKGITGNCEIKVGDLTVTNIEGIEVGVIPTLKMARRMVGYERSRRMKK